MIVRIEVREASSALKEMIQLKAVSKGISISRERQTWYINHI